MLELREDPTGRSLGLELPPGALVDLTVDGRWPEPLLWCAEGRLTGQPWHRAGLYPVLLDRGRSHEWEGTDGAGMRDGRWAWELMPGACGDPAAFDAEQVLAGWWEEYACADDGPWPGPAPARTGEDPERVAGEVTAELIGHGVLTAPRTALVPVARGADVLAAIGWTGPVNYDNDMAPYSAVLRSWEERFGIRVLGLGRGKLHLSVAAPPRTAEEALRVAIEHFAFCPDIVWQGTGGLVHRAQTLVNSPYWSFWWD
ncbi:DUF4253 domain-containing protein [Streptomyces sp. MST-110588]|uniref:DUF4253 domain-containing protein n=1 Tax=Streptomyces sp. MST-110588 TaxID=2833628 RepID=UPI001F5DB85A|nr:DUF4253 domain-containing protein [Streptomyces sp. MST-110588]